MKIVCTFISLLLILNTGNLTAQKMDTALNHSIETLSQSFDDIPEQRKLELKELATVISEQLRTKKNAELIFVCTHNSRRSQLSEIWMRTAAKYYNIQGIKTYSGGTESTAFNVRMVDALKRFGFDLKLVEQGINPVYQLQFGNTSAGEKMFSKKYNDSYNPQAGFIAVMVCSDADRNCPFVEGAAARLSLPYLDPKAFDNSPEEQKAYDRKVIEIGREMLYTVSLL